MDFVINDMELAIEAKGVSNVSSAHLKGLRSLSREHDYLKRKILVCCEPAPRNTEDNIEILPAKHFSDLLWQGKIFQ